MSVYASLRLNRPTTSPTIRAIPAFNIIVNTYRELASINESVDALGGDKKADIKILTSCPSCKQGLSRYRGDTGLDADYLVVEMMRQTLGENWQDAVLKRFEDKGIERVLL